MSVTALPLREAQRGSSFAPVTRWESALVFCALFLASSAVVPMVFNPLEEWGQAAVVRDPVSQPAWLLLSVLTVVAAVRVRTRMTDAMMQNLPIIALCYLALFSVVWSHAPTWTLQQGLQLGYATALGFYVGVRFGVERLVRMLSWVTAAILVLSFVFIFALPHYGIDALRDDTWRGVFETKNEFGRMTVFGGTVWAVRGFAREIPPLRAVVIVGAFAIAGFQSGSRTALGVGLLMLGVFVCAWLLSREGVAWVPVKGFVVSGLAFVGLAAVINVKLLLAVVGADYSLTGRRGIWEAVFSAIANHPWLGYGYETFWHGIYGPSLEVMRSAQSTPHSHNGFLELVLGLGVVGLGIYVAALASVFRRALVALHGATGSARTFPLAFLSLVILYNLTESGLVDERSLEWIVFAAIAAALTRSHPDRDEAVPDGLPRHALARV
jgi:exopolysaccharide production protein ExoQ